MSMNVSMDLNAALQGVVENKNNFLIYNSVSVFFNIKVFTTDLLTLLQTYLDLLKINDISF